MNIRIRFDGRGGSENTPPDDFDRNVSGQP